MISRRHPGRQPRLRLRRAPGARHRRRRDRAADRLRRAVVDPRRLPDRHGDLPRLRGPGGGAARPAGARPPVGRSPGRTTRRPTRRAAGATSPPRGWSASSSWPARSGLLTVGDGFIYLALLDRGGFAAHWFPLLYVGTNVAYLSLAIPIGRLADRVGPGEGADLGPRRAARRRTLAVAVSWNIAAVHRRRPAPARHVLRRHRRRHRRARRAAGAAQRAGQRDRVGPDRRGARPDGLVGRVRRAVVPLRARRSR